MKPPGRELASAPRAGIVSLNHPTDLGRVKCRATSSNCSGDVPAKIERTPTSENVAATSADGVGQPSPSRTFARVCWTCRRPEPRANMPAA